MNELHSTVDSKECNCNNCQADREAEKARQSWLPAARESVDRRQRIKEQIQEILNSTRRDEAMAILFDLLRSVANEVSWAVSIDTPPSGIFETFERDEQFVEFMETREPQSTRVCNGEDSLDVDPFG